MKIIKKNQLKMFIFTAVKYRCILHGRVFIMRYVVSALNEFIMSNDILTLTRTSKRIWATT